MTNRTLPGFSLLMNARLTRVTITAVLVAAVLATSIGCGHQTNLTAPGPLTLAPPSPRADDGTTVPAANNGEVGVYRSEIIMPHSGTATVTLRWPNADFSLQLYVTSGVCADTTSLVTGECAILGSTRPGSLPGLVTSPVTGGDRYTVWVLNPDPAPQSFSVDVNIE
jgi:hypothetical protein